MRRAGTAIIGIVAVLVTALGAMKLLDLPTFADALTGWTAIPVPIQPAVTYGLPTLELASGVLWLSGHKRLASWLLLGLLASMTGVVAIQLLKTVPPKCGCFGLFERYFDAIGSTRLLFGKSVALLSLVCIGMVMQRLASRPTEHSS